MSRLNLTVLVDNATLTDRYFTAEPGLSFYLETDSKKILFDTGYSGLFIDNAYRMGIDPLMLDYIVLSHGHIDHTGGLFSLLHLQLEAQIEGHRHKNPRILMHPYCLYPKPMGRFSNTGSPIPFETLNRQVTVDMSRAPVWIANDLAYLGEIPRTITFPQKPMEHSRKIVFPTGTIDDPLLDDTALAFRAEDGIVVIAGCSHAGICNIIERAKEVCGDDRIVDVIGGFHLLDPTPEELEGTCRYLQDAGVQRLHPCHCTSLAVKVAFAKVAPVHEVGVGLKIEYGTGADK